MKMTMILKRVLILLSPHEILSPREKYLLELFQISTHIVWIQLTEIFIQNAPGEGLVLGEVLRLPGEGEGPLHGGQVGHAPPGGQREVEQQAEVEQGAHTEQQLLPGLRNVGKQHLLINITYHRLISLVV